MLKPLKKILKSKKGMTTIELIVVVALIGILLVPIMDLFITSLKSFNMSGRILDHKAIALYVRGQVENEVRLAKEVTISSQVESSQNSIYIRDRSSQNEVVLRGVDGKEEVVVSAEYLNGAQLFISAQKTVENPSVLKLQIVVDEEYEVVSMIKLENLEGEINGEDGEILNFIK